MSAPGREEAPDATEEEQETETVIDGQITTLIRMADKLVANLRRRGLEPKDVYALAALVLGTALAKSSAGSEEAARTIAGCSELAHDLFDGLRKRTRRI